MPVVAVTGASGFVGRQMVARLSQEPVEVRRLLRRAGVPERARTSGGDVVIGDLAQDPDWQTALRGVDIVIHLAAIAHRQAPDSVEARAELQRMNVTAVGQMAGKAARAGVRRIVLLSSIGVNGAATDGPAFTERDDPRPHDAYSQSKLDAERHLLDAAAHGIEPVIVRAPLVYGPRAPGNFARLAAMVRSGWPLPFGAIANRRSLVSVANLCDLLWRAASDPRAGGELFLVSDGQDVSTPELIRRIAAAQRVPCRLLDVPPRLLRVALACIGRPRDFDRLCGSLVVDSSKARTLLDWRPPQTLDDGLVAAFEAG